MRTMLEAATATLILALAVSGCSKSGEGKDAVGGKPAVAVEVASAAPTTLTQTIDVVGTLEPKYFADVKSEFTAVVTEVYVTQWVHVDKGAPLARLDTREGGRRAARRDRNGAAGRRGRDAGQPRAGARGEAQGVTASLTQQNLDDARSAAEAAAAAAQAAAARAGGRRDPPRQGGDPGPDGRRRWRCAAVNVGDRVENMGGGDPMFRIVDNRVLDLTVSVPSASASAAVEVGQTLDFTVDAYPGTDVLRAA